MSVDASESKSTLSAVQKLGYGLGHVFNDLCSTVWFSYTLLFFKYVLIMPTEAGSYMMLGQLSDAFFSAMVGFMTDLFGEKRHWHMIGSVMVLLSFPAIFILQRDVLPYWGNVFYFSVIITLFQCGWATVQITHLAVISEYSNTERDRSELNAVRYSMSVLANMTVFAVAYAFLHIRDKSSTDAIGPSDFGKFRNITLFLSVCGVLATILFHISLSCGSYAERVREKRESSSMNGGGGGDGERDSSNEKTSLRIMNVLTNVELYKVAFLYTFSRLFLLICIIYIPIWINEMMKMKTGQANIENIAIVPLAFFASSFVAAIALKYISRNVSQKAIYSTGSIISIFGCIIIALVSRLGVVELLAIAVVLGAGSSITQVSSMCISSNFIGTNCSNSGLVYSIVTVCDKIFSGLIIFIIEIIGKNSAYYTGVLVVNGVMPITALFVLFALRK